MGAVGEEGVPLAALPGAGRRCQWPRSEAAVVAAAVSPRPPSRCRRLRAGAEAEMHAEHSERRPDGGADPSGLEGGRPGRTC